MHFHFTLLYYYRAMSRQIIEIYFNFQTTKCICYMVLSEHWIDVKFFHCDTAEKLCAAKTVNYFIGHEVSDGFNDFKI